MTQKPDSVTRNPPRARRLSVSCYLHPADPATGICASCLRERLHGLDSPEASYPSTAGNVGGGSGARPVTTCAGAPELRRCRSVYAAKCEGSASFLEPRRKSCDVGSRNGKSLAHLFDADDEGCNGSDGVRSKVESKNILRSPAFELRAAKKVDDGGEIRGFDGDVGEHEDSNVEEGDFKTMKEYIDLELQNKGQKTKLGGNLWEAASVFSKKLQKWRHKEKKKPSHEEGADDGNGEIKGKKEKNFGESEATEYVKGRGSCDIDPRFSMDAGRISFDEPRASWDGYLIARTIPRLAPMLSVVENAILNSGSKFENHRISVDGGQMHSIMEDESSSGSGGSAQSQSNSDSSSSQRRSSFDRSSSVRSFGKKFVGMEDEVKYGLNASASPKKLVITERELKDWHLRSMKDDHHQKQIKSPFAKNGTEGNNGGHMGSKKQVKWRKMWSVFGFKQKSFDTKSDKSVAESLDYSPAPVCEKLENGVGETIDGNGWKLMRSSSLVGARRSVEVIRSGTNLMNTPDKSECVNKSKEDFVLGRKQIKSSLVGSRRSVEVGSSPGLMNTADKSGCVNKKNKEDFVLGRKPIQSSIVGPRRSIDVIRSSTGLMNTAEKSVCVNKKSKEDFVLEINQSAKHTSSNLEDDVLPFYLTPLRTSRSRRSGRNKLQNSHVIDGHILSLT